MAAWTFREKKNQQQSRVISDVIFDVYNHVDNRARASDCMETKEAMDHLLTKINQN